MHWFGKGDRLLSLLDGKRIVIIIAPARFRDEEYLQPREVLESAGAQVVVASIAESEAIGMLGVVVFPDLRLDAVDPAAFDAVVFVGGDGAGVYFDDRTAHHIAREFAAAGKPVGAICVAPSILARAGLLKGKTATCFPSQRLDLSAHGASLSGRSVVRDGNIVTADGPLIARRFAEELAQLVAEPPSAG